MEFLENSTLKLAEKALDLPATEILELVCEGHLSLAVDPREFPMSQQVYRTILSDDHVYGSPFINHAAYLLDSIVCCYQEQILETGKIPFWGITILEKQPAGHPDFELMSNQLACVWESEKYRNWALERNPELSIKVFLTKKAVEQSPATKHIIKKVPQTVQSDSSIPDFEKGFRLSVIDKVIQALHRELGEEYVKTATGHAQIMKSLLIKIYGEDSVPPNPSKVVSLLQLNGSVHIDRKTVKNYLDHCFP